MTRGLYYIEAPTHIHIPVVNPPVALIFSLSCLYMKTYRVHRIFNNASKLSRVSITDRFVCTANAWVGFIHQLNTLGIRLCGFYAYDSVVTHKENA